MLLPPLTDLMPLLHGITYFSAEGLMPVLILAYFLVPICSKVSGLPIRGWKHKLWNSVLEVK